MDEIVVRIARAIACVARLRILSHLVRDGETAPTAMAKELRMPLNVMSTHLKLLSAVGLVCRRRSGVWHHCKAESPYSETAVSGAVMSWLREVLRAPGRTLKHCRLREVCNDSPAQIERAVHEVVFDAATAFTNVRRIQILRRLAQKAGLGEVKVTPHIFRHTFGTNAAAQGANAFILKEIMGHSSMQTTMRYVHPQPDDLKAQHNRFSMVNELFNKK